MLGYLLVSKQNIIFINQTFIIMSANFGQNAWIFFSGRSVKTKLQILRANIAYDKWEMSNNSHYINSEEFRH